MVLGYLKDSATCKRAFQITGKHANEVIEKLCDGSQMILFLYLLQIGFLIPTAEMRSTELHIATFIETIE